MKERSNRKKRLLIIFYRNPEMGKVKTRLAATVGDAHAFGIYIKLVGHTRTVTEEVEADCEVCYSDHVDTEDNWLNDRYRKSRQEGNDLGKRMQHAFEKGFGNGYTSICIIGTDCFELTPAIVQRAFEALETHNAVIGPAKDGGYYLLGMNQLHQSIFENKQWSTDTVAEDTLQDFRNLGLRYSTLPELSDVDRVEDLPAALKIYS